MGSCCSGGRRARSQFDVVHKTGPKEAPAVAMGDIDRGKITRHT